MRHFTRSGSEAAGDNVAFQLPPAQLVATMLGTAGLVAVWLAAIGL